MKDNYRIGIALSVTGILAGLLLFYFMASQYNLVIDAKIASGRLDEAKAVSVVYPLLGWLGTAAGAVWAVVLYGFVQKQPWAWFWGAVAATVQLLAGFFPAIPAMASGLPVPTMIVFGLALVLWFGVLLIGGVEKQIITLAFVAGLAFVLTFFVGVAPIAKFETSKSDSFWNGMYLMSQQVSWWGSAAWAVFIFALLKKRSWVIPMGIFAGTMAIIGGYPLGIKNMTEVQRFSMFLPGPLVSTALLIYLLLPGTRQFLEKRSAKA